MKSFGISFSNPWLLFLLIPAVGLSLLPYFLSPKKYRKTRNRIISLVLHITVMVLAVTVLAGIRFPYELNNDFNEIIFLVDVSDTQEASELDRDDFLQRLLNETRYDNFKVGVVTFGFDQVYAAPMTYDVGSVYETYLHAPLPDTSATNISAALRYSSELFAHPETAKVVLISDGGQTDENALQATRVLAAEGIKVDTAVVGSVYIDDGVQVLGIVQPEYNVILGETCNIGVTLYSENVMEGAQVQLFDYTASKEPVGESVVTLKAGMQTLDFPVTFETEGLHEMCARYVSENGEVNNRYFSYIYLSVHDKILVLEQRAGDSDLLMDLLGSEYEKAGITLYNLNVDADKLPKTVDELRGYDQVVMNNVAVTDLPADFINVLYSYVYEYGGGLFTTGGSDDNGEAHAYKHENNDFSTAAGLYQSMLPVQAVDYTPPVGVVFAIDASGSMAGENMQGAKNGAIDCVNLLNDRDYVGVMTFSNQSASTKLQLTSCSRENKDEIISAINGLSDPNGGTYVAPAVSRAAVALRAESRVNKRHIIVVTDGEIADLENVRNLAKDYYEKDGITLSVIGISISTTAKANMDLLAADWGGQAFNVAAGSISDAMRNDIRAPEISAYNPTEFYPIIEDAFSPIVNGVEHGLEGQSNMAIPAPLGGYYGVKARSGADVVVSGEYEVPVYAQWQFGAGKVGSFMCDVYGEWSGDFIGDPNGDRLLLNIVANLMPSADIRPTSVTLSLREENYLNQLSVFHGDLKNGETIRGEIFFASDTGTTETCSLGVLSEENGQSVYVTEALDAANDFSRCMLVCKGSGTYTITVSKYDKEGNVLETVQLFKTFSYSKEYDPHRESDGNQLMAEIADKGNGTEITADAPGEVLSGFITSTSRVFDPSLIFIITAIVLFLLDIAVRKFKFKWIHEIVRERRERKERQR